MPVDFHAIRTHRGHIQIEINNFAPKSRSISRTIIQLANDLNMKVVAEGVETETQYELLRNMGCNYFQGYLFGEAGPLSLFAS